MVLAIVTATGTVLLPHVAHSFANGDHAAVKRSLVTSMHVILVLAFPMAFGLAAVAKPFTLIFFGNKFASVGSLMAVESAVIVLIGISNAIGIQYLLPTNQLSAYTASVVLGSVVNVVLNVPLILVWGTMGAIVATVISEATVSIYQIYRIRNQILVHSLFEGIWKYALSAFAMFMVITVVAQLLSPGIFGVMVEVLVGIVAYVAILFMLQPKELFGYIVRFRKK
jgi:O-antigen/teichoic acid export membrane protein